DDDLGEPPSVGAGVVSPYDASFVRLSPKRWNTRGHAHRS
ncbi:MAG: hypothetical protein ACJA2H_001446, partial [Nitriliruptoraceae bacterium]